MNYKCPLRQLHLLGTRVHLRYVTSVPTNMVNTAMAHATPPFLRLLRLTEGHQKEHRLTQELSASPTNGVIYLPALSEHRPSQEDRLKKKKNHHIFSQTVQELRPTEADTFRF